MSPINRVLWYIYSRNFIQKGGSFTHFSQKDYRFFTAFIKKHPLNLGHWIFQEMIKFKFSARKHSHMPFPSLISVILFYHKIWYVGPPETMKRPTPFGKAQLNFMKISFEAEGSGQSRAPSRSQTRASQSRAQEAQSAPSPQTSLPSDLESKIKSIVDSAIAAMSDRIELEVGKLVNEVTRGNHESVDAQEAMKLQINELKDQSARTHSELSDQVMTLDAMLSTQLVSQISLGDKVDKILNHLGIGLSTAFGSDGGPSSSQQKPDSEPSSSSPSFTFDKTPLASTSPNPSTPILSSPLTSPTTPSTEILHLSASPSTEIFQQSPPSTPLYDPLNKTIISDPPHIEDDKGGETDA